MNVKLLSFSLVAVLCVSGVLVLVSDGSEVDADVPSADETFNVITATYYTDSEAQVLDFYELGGDYAVYAEILNGANNQGELSIISSYMPTWITIDYGGLYYTNVTVTISPGAVCDDVFWILYDVFGSRFLLTFDIQVLESDSGTVVPDPDDPYNTFYLYFNTQGGDSITGLSAKSARSSYTFDISEIVPTRDGYTFVCWSTDPYGEAMLSGSVTVSLGDDGTGSRTIYAIWEENRNGLIIPTFWDGLIELFSNPIILLVCLIVFLAVCLFIRNRNIGRYR